MFEACRKEEKIGRKNLHHVACKSELVGPSYGPKAALELTSIRVMSI